MSSIYSIHPAFTDSRLIVCSKGPRLDYRQMVLPWSCPTGAF